MNNREFVMLAKPFDSLKHKVAGWLVSEKFDGQRAIWDGGVTRGKPKKDVPWANTLKDERYVDEQISTGLWSRYGNVIHAPDWWLDSLPNCLLDGELYMERGAFQETRKIVSRLSGGEGWKNIRFLVIDIPQRIALFQSGRINNPQFKKVIHASECLKLFQGVPAGTFLMKDQVERINQTRLPPIEAEAREKMYDMLNDVVSAGGEGLILRQFDRIWAPKRVPYLLKVKPMHDAEATVVGYVWGKGKHAGRMGAMIVQWEDKVFELGTGFTDDEREMYNKSSDLVGHHYCKGDETLPGTKANDAWSAYMFERGTSVTFRYVSLTDDGVPREARYWRCDS